MLVPADLIHDDRLRLLRLYLTTCIETERKTRRTNTKTPKSQVIDRSHAGSTGRAAPEQPASPTGSRAPHLARGWDSWRHHGDCKGDCDAPLFLADTWLCILIPEPASDLSVCTTRCSCLDRQSEIAKCSLDQRTPVAPSRARNDSHYSGKLVR